MTVVSTWPVFVQDWQFECCGDAFAIDDEVAWTLMLLAESAVPMPAEMFIEASVRVERKGEANDGTAGQIVCIGDEVQAWWARDDPCPESVRGVLMEEHHGGVPDDLPRSHGLVRRIRLVTREYRNVGGVTWGPASPAAEYRELTSTPAGFDADIEPEGSLRRLQIGLLVDLEIDRSTPA